MGRRKVTSRLAGNIPDIHIKAGSSCESIIDNNPKQRQNDNRVHCGSSQVCAKAVRELMEKSIATRGEIEAFTIIILSKDSQITECEQKKAELIEKLSFYRERANTSKQTIHDKNELIAIMKQTIERFEANEKINETINNTKDIQVKSLQAIIEIHLAEIANLRQIQKQQIVQMKTNQNPCLNMFTGCWK